MQYEPLLADQMAKQRMKDVLYEAEQDQLALVAKGSSGSPRARRLPIAPLLDNLVMLMAITTVRLRARLQ